MIPMLFRGYLTGLRMQKCGRRLLVYKGLECNIDNAEVRIGDNVRLYVNVKISAIGGGSFQMVRG